MTGDVIVKLTIYTFAQILQTMAAAEEATAAFMRRSEVIWGIISDEVQVSNISIKNRINEIEIYSLNANYLILYL